MPIITLPPPPQAAEVRPFWETEEAPLAQGVEGQQIRDQIRIVSEHWRSQSMEPLAQGGDDLSYQHVPFRSVGRRQVRYVRIEPLQPRHIEPAEDIG